MPKPTMEDQIREARDPAVPDDDLPTPTARVRRRLLRGETVDPQQVADEFGFHVSTVASMAGTLRELGFKVVTEPGPAGAVYRVTNPDHEPSAAAYRKRAARLRAASNGTSVNATTTAVEGVPPGDDLAGRDSGIPPLPDLGQPVVVYALAIDDDGSITLGVRNGHRRWVATITGTVDS